MEASDLEQMKRQLWTLRSSESYVDPTTPRHREVVRAAEDLEKQVRVLEWEQLSPERRFRRKVEEAIGDAAEERE